MVAEMSYNTVSNVVESWEMIRRIDNYQEVAGVTLFKMCVSLFITFASFRDF